MTRQEYCTLKMFIDSKLAERKKVFQGCFAAITALFVVVVLTVTSATFFETATCAIYAMITSNFLIDGLYTDHDTKLTHKLALLEDCFKDNKTFDEAYEMIFKTK